MRTWMALALAACLLGAGCVGDVGESVDGTCADVGDEYAEGGAQGEHCPNETPLYDPKSNAT